MCLEANDPEFGRPKLQKTPDTVVEIKSTEQTRSGPSPKKDFYAELLKLDDLKKRGIITDAEFEALKKKLLSE